MTKDSGTQVKAAPSLDGNICVEPCWPLGTAVLSEVGAIGAPAVGLEVLAAGCSVGVAGAAVLSSSVGEGGGDVVCSTGASVSEGAGGDAVSLGSLAGSADTVSGSGNRVLAPGKLVTTPWSPY